MKTIYLFFSLAIVLTIGGCSSDEVILVSPKADFDFTVNKGTVTFINKSAGADVYAWEFGDESNSVSTKKDAIFKYAAAGTYNVIVTLYAGDGSTGINDHISKTISLVNVPPSIIIDGKLNDWEKIPFVEGVVGKGSLKRIKVDGTGDNINIYLEGDLGLDVSSPQAFFDLDMKGSTGGDFGWYSEPFGADMMSDGSTSWYALHSGVGGTNSWTWNWGEAAGGWIKLTTPVTISSDTKAVEFSFNKSQLSQIAKITLSSKGVYFCFSDKKAGEIPVWKKGQKPVFITF
jgi:PKD repeat protein